MPLIDKINRVEYLLKHMPGRHDQQRHAGNRTVAVRRLYDRADRHAPELVKFSDDMVRDHLGSYPDAVVSDLGDVEVVVASDQFLPADVAGAGGGYLHNTAWVSNSWSRSLGMDLLDHELGHALMDKLGPGFATFWHDKRNTYLIGDAEEDASDEFAKYIAGSGSTIWNDWYKD